MACRLRYTRQEEQLLLKLKEEYPKNTWFNIVKHYNSVILDPSRRRTEQALISKYKNIRKRKKHSSDRRGLDISYQRDLETVNEMYTSLWIRDHGYPVTEQPALGVVPPTAELPVYDTNPTEEQPDSSVIYGFNWRTPLDIALGYYVSVEDYYTASVTRVY